MSTAVVVVSGGLDSTTLMYHIAAQGWEIAPISFNYGQRHSKELEFAKYHTNLLQSQLVPTRDHHVVDLSSINDLFAESGSSLVTGEDVPEGHYGEESMKSTIVPNRNMIMLSIAAGYAVSIGASKLCVGVHAGDHFIYPDCRPVFIAKLEEAIWAGNQGFLNASFHIDAPFISKSKNDIAQRAFDLNVPIDQTWSCYKGGDLHCGRCGTCVERLEAIASTGNEDPTHYEDDQFWREALKRETV